MQIKQNVISGVLVSFIALPLCIAIASASQFPVMSGILTAIVGGILVSQINGSHLTIYGPAAGMIAVIIDAVEKLGNGDFVQGYKYTICAILLVGILQFFLSFFKIIEIMRKFPEIIIRAMMMAIGIIVVVKQIFVINGFKPASVDVIGLFEYLPKSFLGMEIENFAIGLFAIISILLWNKYLENKKYFRVVPVYLLVIIAGIIIANFLHISSNQHFLNPNYASPITSNFVVVPDKIISAINFPDFRAINSLQFWLATLTIFAVGTLETLLSCLAIDKIDPQKRTTNLQKELRAIGIGNAICGSIGALPMIAEIVRSTANVRYKATSKYSNFVHGFSLLLMISIFSFILKFIPLAVLAGMLIIIGINMINLKLFYQIFKNSKSDVLVIILVIFFTLKIDLLAGILSGLIFWLINQKLFPHVKKIKK
ncbi:MAG: SulP family inorganic anion transporter [Alphaproteobacteria bacterium]